MSGLAASTAGGGPVTMVCTEGTIFGTTAGVFRVLTGWRSSSDDESSTASTPNEPPYVLRGGAATPVDFGFISSMLGLGLEDDDDFPTVSHD